jgi:hypothetical protein
MRGISITTKRRHRGLAGAVVASLLALALMAGTAQGAVYQQMGSFSVPNFASAVGVAMDIDQSSGKVYVVDRSNEILVFDSAGNPLSSIGSAGSGQWAGVGVDNSSGPNAGTIYAYSNGPAFKGIEAFTAAGNLVGTPFFVGSLSNRGQFKVGPNGSIYFGHSEGNTLVHTETLRIYKPDGTLQQTINCSTCPGSSEFNSYFHGVGVDSAGNIYTDNEAKQINEVQAVTVTATEGTFTLSYGAETTEPIAFDASDAAVRAALGTLPSINQPSSPAVDQEGTTYKVKFPVKLSGENGYQQLTADSTGLAGGSVSIETLTEGSSIPGRVLKFDAAGENPSVLAEGFMYGLGLDPASGNSFVIKSDSQGSNWHVVGYDSGGNEFIDFGLGTIGGNRGTSPTNPLTTPLAVNSSTGAVYVGDRANGKVWIYAPVPSAATTAATSVTKNAATLNGTVNPNDNGAITDCHFEWGTNTEYKGGTVPCASNPPNGNSSVPVEGALSGLSPKTTYHYRLVANNGKGPVKGDDQTFTTPIAEPIVTTGAAASITNVSAQLTGSVNPNGGATTCAFEYGTSESYGSEIACTANPGSGSSAVSVGAALKGLTPETTYHYRLKATNSGGEAKGAVDKTFTTLPNAPVVSTEAASGVSQNAATLNAKVNANGDPADCSFEYGTSASYGSTVSCSIDPLTGEASTAVSASLSGLSAGTTYHYRVVAENGGGKSTGADMTFTTNAAPALPPPAVTPPAGTPPTNGDNGAAKQACIAKAMKAFKKAKKAAAKKKGKAKAKAMQAASKQKAKAIKQCNAA